MNANVTLPTELEAVLAGVTEAATVWAETPRTLRAQSLRAVADALDASSADLVPLAQEETHLAEGRLIGELSRTTFQLRLFANVLDQGLYLDARIDHADDTWPMGARPDLRRVQEPIGPVIVYAASNFPFAFSVAGGDTASALAAGCPVVLKSHPGHPKLSALTSTVVVHALSDAGGPERLLQVIHGTDVGVAALKDPRMKAGSFTGSIAGGRALFDIAASRPEPIPFYAEMGSVNPAFVTQAAARARAEEVAQGFVASFTLGAGQFCTKPGVLAVPAGSAIIDHLRNLSPTDVAPLLNEHTQHGYVETLRRLLGHEAVTTLTLGDHTHDNPPSPTLLTASIDDVLAHPEALLTECFGPAALVVTYTEETQLLKLADCLDGQLTATIFGEEQDPIAPNLTRLLARTAGRVLWNQWPTGVSVTYAQQHGGPYPATTAPASTSVGTAAIDRFLRPVAYQGMPQHLLPDALKDANPLSIPQSINGNRT